MTLTDRDKKIILIMLIFAVLALPYVFYTQDAKAETETINGEIVTLNDTLNRLHEMDQNREFYQDETVRYNGERDAIIARFPAGIHPANYTMFLLNTEYSSEPVPDENGIVYVQYPIRFDSVSYGINEEYAIAGEEDSVELDYTAVSNLSAVTFVSYYDGMKYMLEYLMDYPDPMIYSSINMSYDPEYNEVAGDFILSQYAILGGEGRELPDVVIDPDVDDLGWRGVNTEDNPNGIFGAPILSERDLTEEETAAPAEELPEDAGEGDGDHN